MRTQYTQLPFVAALPHGVIQTSPRRRLPVECMASDKLETHLTAEASKFGETLRMHAVNLRAARKNPERDALDKEFLKYLARDAACGLARAKAKIGLLEEARRPATEVPWSARVDAQAYTMAKRLRRSGMHDALTVSPAELAGHWELLNANVAGRPPHHGRSGENFASWAHGVNAMDGLFPQVDVGVGGSMERVGLWFSALYRNKAGKMTGEFHFRDRHGKPAYLEAMGEYSIVGDKQMYVAFDTLALQDSEEPHPSREWTCSRSCMNVMLHHLDDNFMLSQALAGQKVWVKTSFKPPVPAQTGAKSWFERIKSTMSWSSTSEGCDGSTKGWDGNDLNPYM